MQSQHVIQTIDSHTGGEPTRLVVSGIPLRGSTLLEQRAYMSKHQDHLRTALMREPRGHRGMFGAVIAPPTHSEVDFGIIWIGNTEYLNMCGHGTIGIGVSAVEAGLVAVTEPVTHLRIDMPAGVVAVTVEVANGQAQRVAFTNVASFVYARDVMIELNGFGKVPVDITFGGSFFGAVKGQALDIEVRPERVDELVAAGVTLRHAINEQIEVQHPTLDHIRSVDLVTIYGPPVVEGRKYKNIHVFGDGQFDRSPGGTGTSHMMAMLSARGEMRDDEEIVSEGITGSLFGGRIVGRTHIGPFDAIVPEVSGTAYLTGMHQFLIDPRDPQKEGFLVP